MEARLLVEETPATDSVRSRPISQYDPGNTGETLCDAAQPQRDIAHQQGKVLRKRVFHSDFGAASIRLAQPSDGVRQPKGLPEGVQELENHVQGIVDGTVTGAPVSDLSAKAGGVFGWFLEAGFNGTFVAAEKAFVSVIAIIHRLSQDSQT